MARAATCNLVALSLIASAVPAAAQTPRVAAPRAEVSVLGMVSTGGDLGTSEATLLGNSVPSGAPVRLFEAEARLPSTPSGEVRVGVRVTRAWLVEGGVSFARPRIEVMLSNDLEGASDVMAGANLTQVTLDGALVRRWARGRLAPFALAGAGYVRHLDVPRTTMGTGQVYYAGGGMLYGLGSARRGAGHLFRLRADVRLVGHRGGVALMDARPLGVTAGVGFAVRIR